MAKNSSKRIVSPVGRLSFPALFVPEVNQNNPNAPAKYSTVVVFDEDTDISSIEEIIAEATKATFGDDAPANLRNPIRDGSEKAHLGDPFGPGKKFVTVKSNFQPGIVGADLQPVLDQSEVYPGVYARVQMHAYGYDQNGNRGIALGLDNVQKIKDGGALDGRSDASSAFEAVDVDDLLS